MIGPKGKFMLEPDDDRTHLFVSTGTGIAPFIAMMRETLAGGRAAADGDAPRLLVRRRARLRGRSCAAGRRRQRTRSATYQPSPGPNDPRNAGWTGRTGRVETIVEAVCHDMGLRPERTVVYICGNPGDDPQRRAHPHGRRGFPEFHVKKELYWPKGKTAGPAVEASS